MLKSGLFITVILYAKNVKGSILIGILSTWILGMLCQLVGIYVPNPDTGFYSLYPTFKMIDITAIGDTFIIAMNIYSDQIQSIDELKDGDTVAIPDDASNGGRALKVLESAGIIEIDPDAGANPTVSDITNYKVQVDITELGASTIPSVIPDFTIAVVNGNYALDYGIDPSTAIFKESEYDDDSYFCLIAVKSGNADDPVYQEIVKLFQSEETKQIFEDKFGGYFVPAWEAKTK